MNAIQPLSQLTRQRLEREVTDAAYRAAGEATGLTLAGYPCRVRLRFNPAAFVDPCNNPLVEANVVLTKHKIAYPDVTVMTRAMGHASIGLREEGAKNLDDPNALREFACMTAEFAGRNLATVPIHEIEVAVKRARANWQQIEPLALALIAEFDAPDMIGDQEDALDGDDYLAP